MAIRNIVKDGDEILLKKCRAVEKFDERLHELLDDMAETLVEANGAGLAAPQVGVMRCVCLVQAEEDGEILELINPEIVKTDGEQFGLEGCLSFPGEFGLVERPNVVTVKAQDRNGNWFEKTGEELCARAFCHEIDHLKGVVFKTQAKRMVTPEELETGEIPELMSEDEELNNNEEK